MNNRLEAKLSLLEATRTAMLARLKDVDIQKLNTPPALGKWSVAQIIYHLNKAESQSVIYVGKKMLDVNNIKESGFVEKLKILLVKLAFKSPFKFRAPVKTLGDVPSDVDYKTISLQWDETRKRLKELLTSLPEDMLTKKVFKQPAAGRLDIYQMLDFMQVHLERHVKQVERTLAGVGK